MSSDPGPPFLSERYQVLRVLGSGGMATVYLAEDLKHGRKVAVKVMKPEVARAIGDDRFLREIQIAARLNHPHVLPLFDSGGAGDQLFYVTPYIGGESLRERLRREGRLAQEEALRLAREVLGALGHAHHHGIVHRDIKPENILLAEGIALVADFGIARAMAMSAQDPAVSAEDAPTLAVTRIGAVLGSPRYMSPEQATGGRVDARTDLYALACVLYEMLAGAPPFDAPTYDALIRMHATAEPSPIAAHLPSTPAALGAVIAKGLAKDPDARYETAARFADALAAAERDAGADTTRPAAGGAAPPPPTAPNNLPRPRTRFIGRGRELDECERLLGETRLLTLTGIGGCGKTRLAMQLGARMLESFPDGVRFADLAPLTDGSRVAQTAAAALGVREAAGEELAAILSRHVAGKHLLLILDNCEHLLAACSDLADSLLGAGENLRILATSREGLGIAGERLFALRSLAVPAADASRDIHTVESSEAVQLFMDRARAALPGLALGGENAPVIAEICRRLDGIPLAIELAAARVKILSVDQIRARLDDRFRLLTGGRAALARHQTLQATIQWSYEQLSSDEQRLLQRLSVFAGGGTLGSVARVTDEKGDEFETMDRLTRLVDKSLVLVDRDRGGEPRYGLLETVRQYARDRLQESGDAPAVRRAHFEEFAALAERAFAERLTREEAWSARLEEEHDNLRAALDSVRDTEPGRYLELAGALGWFWQVRSHAIEGRERLIAALGAAGKEPTAARARALWSAANLLTWQGKTAAAQAMTWMREALDLWRRIGDDRETALALEGIGWAQLLGGDDEGALATFRECLRLQRVQGNPVLVNRAMVALAQTLVALGQVEEARSFSEEIIAFGRKNDDRRSEHFGWHFLADCALIEGRCDESLGLYGQSLALARVLGDRIETSFEIQGVAMSLAGLGDSRKACLLGASVRGEFTRLGVDPHMRFWDALLDRYLVRARETLGSDAAERAEKDGRLLSFDDAVELAQGASGGTAERA